MDALPQIINTDIISSSQDIFWQNISQVSGWECKPVLVITNTFSSGSAEEDQLMSILKAGCKLTDGQYHILKLDDGSAVAWHKLNEQIHPNVVLLFGISSAQLGIHSLLRLNEINNFDRCFWVPTITLPHLIQDKSLKLQLWNSALKPLFELKTHGDVLLPKE